MKIAVLGSNDSAFAIAFEWASKGHNIYMYDLPDSAEAISEISILGGIYSVGQMEGFQKIVYAGEDLEQVLVGADIIFVVEPADRVEDMGQACSRYACEGQRYVVMPSTGMGALAFKNALGLSIDDDSILVAETHTVPYISRIVGRGKISVFYKLESGYKVAAIPKKKSEEIYELLKPVFTGIEKAESVLQTTLQNCNPVTQPAITTLNAALIERTQGDFFFYNDGVTPAVAKIMKIIDDERIAIGKTLDLAIESSVDLGMRQGIIESAEYESGYSNSPEFDRIIAQTSLDYRFYTEDVGFTMIFWIELAEKIGVPVPMMTAISTIVSGILQRDFRKESPRTLEHLRLNEYSLEELKAL